MSLDSVVIVAHKYLTQPDDELVAYLNARRTPAVLHVCHSFSDARDRRSSWVLYRDGERSAQGTGRDYAGWPEPVIYLKEVVLTLLWSMRLGRRWDMFVGMDGLCVLCGNLLRAVGKVSRTVYWVIDFVPNNRFQSALKNRIYASINRAGYRRSDEVWDLSPRMADARERLGGIKPSEYRSNRVVPYGIWPDRIRRVAYRDCERHTLVFMGHLLEKQGVQLVIRAMPRIVEAIPEFRFKIIGGGSYRAALEGLAAECGVADRCRFLGKIERITELEEEVARSAVAIAPYIRALDTWTLYADPGKVKTYLACGVPVLLTDVPWNAAEIERSGCGKIITEDADDIVGAVVLLMDPSRNQNMRDRASKFSQGFEWPAIFAAALGYARNGQPA